MAREGGQWAISRVPGLLIAGKLFATGAIDEANVMSSSRLEAAHIIPHWLGQVDPSGVLVSETRPLLCSMAHSFLAAGIEKIFLEAVTYFRPRAGGARQRGQYRRGL